LNLRRRIVVPAIRGGVTVMDDVFGDDGSDESVSELSSAMGRMSISADLVASAGNRIPQTACSAKIRERLGHRRNHGSL
jgi:hypothetical protein